jgi:hypothetical protein
MIICLHNSLNVTERISSPILRLGSANVNAEGVQNVSYLGRISFLTCDLIAFLASTTSSKTIICLVKPASLVGLVFAGLANKCR